jgi:hypothetical protein
LIEIKDGVLPGVDGVKAVRFVLRRNFNSALVNFKQHPHITIKKFAAKFNLEVPRLVMPSPSTPLKEGYPQHRLEIPEWVVSSEKQHRRFVDIDEKTSNFFFCFIVLSMNSMLQSFFICQIYKYCIGHLHHDPLLGRRSRGHRTVGTPADYTGDV